MLVLGREKDQSIRIGNDVVITIVGCRPGRCKLCIDAPKDIKIVRTEVEGKRDAA